MSEITPLRAKDGPLVWIARLKEGTGLDVQTDMIIEIAVIITNGNLDPVDEGIEYVIKTDKDVLDRMGEWCTKQHGESGLTAACLASPYTYEQVSAEILAYVKKWIPDERTGILAGSSVHADKRFLAKGMPELDQYLHYRIVDVSSIKELAKRWYPGDVARRGEKEKERFISHRALDDIKASINELKTYRRDIFLSREEYIAKHKVEES
ncbi:hypothetical protein NliqN6_6273 [Naganishia liquefaciens]|uniref:Exonuclease domain-containing protein n=1 Tax=Naganishia liquefaciens TaxID=104408 RepID=A0A8H3TZQ7_9TREE|nr:hypothetical protein NliqN6_6273 [Naganishia liquefaciens]